MKKYAKNARFGALDISPKFAAQASQKVRKFLIRQKFESKDTDLSRSVAAEAA